MEFNISYTDKIRVFNGKDLFLYADIKNRIKLHLRFYKGDTFLLETDFFGFLVFKSVKIKSQSLLYPITSIKQQGVFGFEMRYADHVINTTLRPFRQPSYILFLDDNKVGEIYDPRGITVGRKYVMKTEVDDQTVNLYLLFIFLTQLSPLP
ncbi:hypothetical protein [Flavisolibacter ginsenosidimutans]|uniref:Uncharacterized protein n=1 Tax=Flavisolibacter ginsenosidimutans TaxID=661481 RepID=A0A5B8ULM2_9BACT|nr:hypothetical protein [Flavisolibacter ginsenosidimutans]QEC57601.1 hypothetical protein FSB75_17380 [Flavisolibacter ginsenosidimutans]